MTNEGRKAKTLVFLPFYPYPNSNSVFERRVLLILTHQGVKMKYTVMTVTALLAGTYATAAQADIVNGGFEAGLANFEAIGEVEIVTSDFGSGPVEGDAQVFLSTASEGDFGGPGGAVSIAELEEFIGSFPDADEEIDGSAIQTTFTPERGDQIGFSWNFLTDEGVTVPGYLFNDYAFAVLESEMGSEAFLLSDTMNPAFATAPATATDFFVETGFQSFSAPIEPGVEYTLSIGVVDVAPAGGEDQAQLISGLLVDEVQLVPEPTATFGLLLLGAGILGVKRRKADSLRDH